MADIRAVATLVDRATADRVEHRAIVRHALRQVMADRVEHPAIVPRALRRAMVADIRARRAVVDTTQVAADIPVAEVVDTLPAVAVDIPAVADIPAVDIARNVAGRVAVSELL